MAGKSSTFSNERLCLAWRDVLAAGGTRADVVAKLGLDPVLGYQNVSQRVKNLTGKGMVFPPLNAGQRGRRVSTEEIARLAALIADPVTV
jgi:hypothetical protein